MKPLLELNLSAIRDNYKHLCHRLNAGRGIPVVKDDGYGLGAEAVVQAIEGEDVEAFAVATLEEAQHLESMGVPARKILVMYAPPEPDEIEALLASPYQVAVGSRRMVEVLERMENPRAWLHLHVDIGMHRMGLLPEVAESFLEHFPWKGLMIHFPVYGQEDRPLFASLASRAEAWVRRFRASFPQGVIHIANTALTIEGWPWLRGTFPRVGLGLWGLLPGKGLEDKRLRLAFRLKAPVLEVKGLPKGVGVSYGWLFRTQRPSTIGVIAVGYADGLPRALSNRGWVVYKGQRFPIIGAVTMDLTLVDFTDGPIPSPGEEVILLGNSPAMTPDDWAERAGTIVYEVLTGLGKRALRSFFPAEV